MNSYTIKITPAQAAKLKVFFEESGASFDTIQHALWRALMPSSQAVYYRSGKLLLQGKDVSAEAEKIHSLLEFPADEMPEIRVHKQEQSLIETNGENYIGTDESGKGDLFGPLVIAGVQSDGFNSRKFIDLGVKDSKKLNDAKIIKMAAYIKAHAVHSVVVIMPQKYNELYSKLKNLNKLLAWGHARAIENILEKSPCGYALADKFGDESLIQNALMKNGRKIILKQCVRAEADIITAAASILARAEFLKRMQELSDKYEMKFSKGVSPDVISEAEDFIRRYSFSRFNEIAKMHFKTALKLRNEFCLPKDFLHFS